MEDEDVRVEIESKARVDGIGGKSLLIPLNTVTWEYSVLISDPRIAGMIPEAKLDLEKHEAARAIQTCAKRGIIPRSRQKRKILAATSIQSVFRGQRVRADYNGAAVRIQKHCRAFAARRFVRGKRIVDDHRQRGENRKSACCILQRAWRCFSARRELRRKRRPADLSVIRLQALVRGEQTRRKLRQTAAATHIQRCARGRMGRLASKSRQYAEVRADAALEKLSRMLPETSVEYRISKTKAKDRARGCHDAAHAGLQAYQGLAWAAGDCRSGPVQSRFTTKYVVR